ncbi:MAG: hypothetical protein WCK67_08030 [bacterium]
MDGWIKLHRQIIEWDWYKDPNTFKLFLHLLLMANHNTNKWRGVTIEKGQVLTGRIILSQQTGLSEQEIRTSLKRLKSTNELTIKTTAQYSIITLNNWHKYQDINQQSNQQLTSNQPASNQQLTTNKNERIKELNNNNLTNVKLYGEFKNIFLSNDEILKLREIYQDRFSEAIEILSSYVASKGKKYKSHYAVLGKHNWVYKRLFEDEKISRTAKTKTFISAKPATANVKEVDYEKLSR